MAGVKGRSGRKPLLEYRTVEEILKVSSDILLRWLNNPKVDDSRKIPVVSQLIAKQVPARVEGEGFASGSNKVVVMITEKANADTDNRGRLSTPLPDESS